MAKLSKAERFYDLNRAFSDRQGNVYSKTAVSSLVLWLEMTTSSPTDKGPNSLTAAYDGTPNPAPSLTKLDASSDDIDKRYAVLLSDDNNVSIDVDGNAVLSHSTLASGASAAAGADKAFSVSVWVKNDRSLMDSTKYFFWKAATLREYAAEFSANRQITFRVRNNAGTNELRVVTGYLSADIIDDKWAHIVFTYSGGTATASTDYAESALKVYVNGHLQETTGQITGTYVSMEPLHTGDLHVGAITGAANNEWEGDMSEFAMWSGHELTQAEITAIYRVTTNTSRMRQFQSGIVSLPTRVQLRDRDHTGGHYPMSWRTGDHNTSKRSNLPFDDTNTVNFVSSFAQAEIIFAGTTQAYDFIDLTGSSGVTKKRFQYVLESIQPVPSANVKMFEEGIWPAMGLRDPGPSAQLLVKEVNKLSGSLGIKASYNPVTLEKYDIEGNVLDKSILGHRVRLKHLQVGAGSFELGNKISVGRAIAIDLDTHLITTSSAIPGVSHTQFIIGSTLPVKYPGLIGGGGSKSLLSAGLATPNTMPTMEVSASVIPGISDVYYEPKRNYAISPFAENRIKIQNDSPNDAVGTPSTILEGFTYPLKSKTQIVVEMISDDTVGDRIFFASGTLGAPGTYDSPTAGLAGSGFAYWRHDLRRWEMLETWDHPGSTKTVYGTSTSNRTAYGLQGFSLITSGNTGQHGNPEQLSYFKKNTTDGSESEHNLKMAQLSRGFGVPISTFGFPVASQYNATSSHVVNMSKYITSPFLLERMRIEIDGVFGTGFSEDFDQKSLPITRNLFIVNQPFNGDKPHIRTSTNVINTTFNENGASAATWTSTASSFDNVQETREIIGWAKIGFMRNDNWVLYSKSVLDDRRPLGLFGHPLNPYITTKKKKPIDVLEDDYDCLYQFDPAAIATQPGLTASLSFDCTPKLGLADNSLSFSTIGGYGVPAVDNPIGSLVTGNPHGGANLLGYPSGRQIASSLGGTETLATGSMLPSTDWALAVNATAVSAIDTAGMGSDTKIRFTVPAAAGGETGNGGVTDIFFDSSETTNPVEDANMIAIGSGGGQTDDQLATLVIAAINGTVNANIDPASSGNGQDLVGVKGITASLTAGETTKITLTVDSAVDDGNDVTLASEVDGSHDIVDVTVFTGGVTAAGAVLKTKKENYKVSPYLLMPTDNLIIGWQNLANNVLTGSSANAFNGYGIAERLIDKLQRVKITFYGSLIRDGREHHDTLDQNLSTNEIHEVIYGEKVTDQFDVEPLLSLSGSTHDALFYGSMNPAVITAGVRGRRASIATGQAGSTGSLQRNIGFYNSSTRFKDSLVPPIYFLLNNPTFFTRTAGLISSDIQPFSNPAGANNGNNGREVRAIVLSNKSSAASFKLLKHIGLHNDNEFIRSTTFHPASNYLQVPGGGKVTEAEHLVFDTNDDSVGTSKYMIFSGSNEWARGVNSFGSPEIARSANVSPPKLLSTTAMKVLISSIFYSAPSIKPGKISWPITKIFGAGGGPGVIPEIRGFKYGLCSTTPVSPKTYFRRNSYGQFRDRMEQPPETHFVGIFDLNKGKTVDSWREAGPAVKCEFWSRNGTQHIDPLDTNSQNLSTFATSSMPYYDGLNKERDVANNPPPDTTDVTTLEEAVSAMIDGEA